MIIMIWLLMCDYYDVIKGGDPEHNPPRTEMIMIVIVMIYMIIIMFVIMIIIMIMILQIIWLWLY